jgi:RNA polymerase sigma-70 factor (ECF subfamily)
MTVSSSGGERALLAAARGGEEGAFARLTRPYRRELHVHCYRLLGNPHDADDALQETMLRAWRHLGSYSERAGLRTWLYRIATNACLRVIERRPAEEPLPLMPYPDRLLDVADAALAPERVAVERETFELAYVAAVRVLPPRQRAALVLREALGLSAAEIADLLETSVAAVNSALQRARAALDSRADALPPHRAADDAEERRVVDAFLAAWAAVDIDALIAVLARDAVLTMPPEDVRISGAEAVGRFFATEPAGGRLDRIRLVETRANGQPGLAAYLREDDAGDHEAYGIMVLTIDAGRVTAITGFPGAAAFEPFGLPPRV